MGVAALALVHERPHAIAGDRAGHEHDVPAVPQPCDALPAIRERLDLQLEHVSALRAARRRGGLRIGAFARAQRLDRDVVLAHRSVEQL